MRNISTILISIALLAAISGCQQGSASGDANAQDPDLINDTFPEAQAEIQEVIDETFQRVILIIPLYRPIHYIQNQPNQPQSL